MSAALRFEFDATRSTAPTVSPPPLASTRTSFHPSMRPTLVPCSRTTMNPILSRSAETLPPSTQRSATAHPRFEASARHDIANLLAVLRANVEFLDSLLHAQRSAMTASALDALYETVDQLERRVAACG